MWLTGLSGSGKSTIARALATRIAGRGHRVEILDGDEVRTNLSAGLSFSKEDRDANVRRIGWVCELLSRNGVVAIAAAISPYRAARDEVRARIGRFVEIHVDASLDALEARDSKGLYRRARDGALTGLTGVDDPYEPPERAELTIRNLTAPRRPRHPWIASWQGSRSSATSRPPPRPGFRRCCVFR